jgi:peroxiredoxin
VGTRPKILIVHARRTAYGVIRSAVLIAADGTVLKVWKRVQARTFAERALVACKTLLAA